MDFISAWADRNFHAGIILIGCQRGYRKAATLSQADGEIC
jgi:hypothetical protein